RKKAYDKLLIRSKVLLKTYAKSDYLDEVYNLRGLAYIAQKQYVAASQQLKKAIEISSNESLKNMASYNLAYVHFELGQADQASSALETMKPSILDKGDRVKFYVLRAKLARLRQDYAGSAGEILSALKNTNDPQSQVAESMLTFLDEVLEPVNNILQ